MMKKIAVLNEFSIEAVRDALQKLDDFPKLIVNGLNAYQLNEIESIDPILFGAIGKRIADGRWFPEVGTWCGESGKISEANLIKNILYSALYFKDKFGKKFRVFHGETVYNNALAQIAYAAEFDACYIKDEKETVWLDSADDSRVLVGGALDVVDINDLDDDFINANEFGSIEDEIISIYTQPLDLKAVRLGYEKSIPTETEALLLEAGKLAVQNGEKINEELENLWLSLFVGDDVKEDAEKLVGGRSFDDKMLTVDSDEVELVEMKYAEDESGDVIIRLKETAGKEKTLFVMCDALNAGFRCQILPYELQSFRIDKDGFVTEIFITE